jgi:hypothetical protein
MGDDEITITRSCLLLLMERRRFPDFVLSGFPLVGCYCRLQFIIDH